MRSAGLGELHLEDERQGVGFLYDSPWDMTTVTDARTNDTVTRYDDLGRLIWLDSPGWGTRQRHGSTLAPAPADLRTFNFRDPGSETG